MPFTAALVGPLYTYIAHIYNSDECMYRQNERGVMETNLEPGHHNGVQGQAALFGESVDHNGGLEHACKL